MRNSNKKMPNTLFKYSKSLGMMERKIGDVQDPDGWYDSKDQALITHYLCELALAQQDQDRLKKELQKTNETIEWLHQTFGHLVNKYPEEFI